MSTPFPNSSPSREQANSHPYAVKTTSTGLLSRSNSNNRSPHSSHMYTPATPPSQSTIGYRQARGHRHSKSMPSVTPPPPLPMPPSPSLPNKLYSSPSLERLPLDKEGSPSPSRRVHRADTLPSLFTDPAEERSADPIEALNLPDNPKLWTHFQLSKYLSSVLSIRNGGTLPDPVVKDITDYVVSQKLTGRTFIRLSEQSLEEMGVNPGWRPKFLAHANTLRKKVVQGRIMGFGSPSTQQTGSKARVPSTVDEGDEPRTPWTDRGSLRLSPGKVRGMVASFERTSSQSSASEDEFSAFQERRRFRTNSTLSREDDEEGRFASSEYSDHEHERSNSSTLLVPDGNELLESPISSAESAPFFTPPPPAYDPLIPNASNDPSISNEKVDVVDPDTSLESNTTVGVYSVGRLDVAETGELTVSELLEKENMEGSWGAKAWENVDIGNTAKKIDDFIPPEQGHERSERTSLTTLFDGVAGDDDMAAKHLDEVVAPHHQHLSAEAMEMIEMFRRRLEEVERKLREMEERELEAQKMKTISAEKVEPLPVDEQDAPSQVDEDILNEVESPEVSKESELDPNLKNSDPNLAALPTYVLAVGLGVCVIILRVMLKRMANRRN